MTKREFAHYFASGETKRKYNHNAEINTLDGVRVLTLHYTDIVRIEDNKMYFDAGGWKTATTMSYMNMVLEEFGSHQIDNHWYFDGEVKFEDLDYLDLSTNKLVCTE